MDLQTRLTLFALLLIILGTALGLFVYPAWHRRRVSQQPFPAHWLDILQARLPVYSSLSGDEKTQLQQLIRRFLDRKHFVGCAGQVINDEVRVTIAAHACLLLLNRPSNEYESLRSILVYPTSFIVQHDFADEAGLVTEGHDILNGESWSNGRIVLAWDDVEHGVHDFSDGYNVVLHEFAHQLDHESGIANGAPVLGSNGAYKNWARVFSDEFEKLQASAGSHLHSLIDEYGATDPAEFFAVVTETFYEKPEQMAVHHQALFEELKSYYRVDPRQWKRPTPAHVQEIDR